MNLPGMGGTPEGKGGPPVSDEKIDLYSGGEFVLLKKEKKREEKGERTIRWSLKRGGGEPSQTGKGGKHRFQEVPRQRGGEKRFGISGPPWII